jgi:cation transport ATPase
LRYGALYGVLLYAAMTYVVVPLSRAGNGALPAWRWENLSHIAVHMLLVGVPCALAAQCAMRRRTLV